VPLPAPNTDPEQLQLLEEWLRSYRPWELFDANGALRPELRQRSPLAHRRMGSNPHANGGLLRRKLHFPAVEDYAVLIRCGCLDRMKSPPTACRRSMR